MIGFIRTKLCDDRGGKIVWVNIEHIVDMNETEATIGLSNGEHLFLDKKEFDEFFNKITNQLCDWSQRNNQEIYQEFPRESLGLHKDK